MKTIWKYRLEPGTTELQIPGGAQILTVQEQFNGPCVWALVDPTREKETVRFHVYGTGHLINVPTEKLYYIGTFQLLGGDLVFHVFGEGI